MAMSPCIVTLRRNACRTLKVTDRKRYLQSQVITMSSWLWSGVVYVWDKTFTGTIPLADIWVVVCSDRGSFEGISFTSTDNSLYVDQKVWARPFPTIVFTIHDDCLRRITFYWQMVLYLQTFYYTFAIIGMEIFQGKIRYFGNTTYNLTLLPVEKYYCGNPRLKDTEFWLDHYCRYPYVLN